MRRNYRYCNRNRARRLPGEAPDTQNSRSKQSYPCQMRMGWRTMAMPFLAERRATPQMLADSRGAFQLQVATQCTSSFRVSKREKHRLYWRGQGHWPSEDKGLQQKMQHE